MNRGVIVLKGLQGVEKEQLADAILLKLVSEFLPGSEGGGCLKTSSIGEVLRDKIEVLLMTCGRLWVQNLVNVRAIQVLEERQELSPGSVFYLRKKKLSL